MLSQSIKIATEKEHQKLEKKVIGKLKSINNESSYAEMLKIFYAYFGAIEEAIKPFITSDLLPDYSQRRSSKDIKQDILELGSDVNDSFTTNVPQITNSTQALGALYVLEGSIMGGSIIVKVVEKAGIKKGISFFSGYGQNTSYMWSTFIDVLNKNAETEEKEVEAIQSADETFEHFSRLF
jgi:heme oxygenase